MLILTSEQYATAIAAHTGYQALASAFCGLHCHARRCHARHWHARATELKRCAALRRLVQDDMLLMEFVNA